jgi:hypothetical protein
MASAMSEDPHRPRGLGDPDQARHAWARFRHLMAWMVLAGAACSAGVIAVMGQLQGPLHLVTMFAVLGGVGGSVALAGALMGLVFLSSGTGHDEDVERID